MKIKIMVDGPYSDFKSDPPARAVKRQAGEIVDVPEWYAASLIAAGLAQAKQTLPEVKAPEEPEAAKVKKPTQPSRRGKRNE